MVHAISIVHAAVERCVVLSLQVQGRTMRVLCSMLSLQPAFATVQCLPLLPELGTSPLVPSVPGTTSCVVASTTARQLTARRSVG